MIRIKHFKTVVFTCLLCFGLACPAYASDVVINGQMISQAQKTMLESEIGTLIEPGNYISNGNCWVNLSNGKSGCLSNAYGNTNSRYGSGERTPQGDWNHWSNAADGAVGGSSDGCLYTTFGWSSC